MIFFDKLSFIGIIVANSCRAACPLAAENVIAKPYETADPGQAALQSLNSLLHKLSFRGINLPLQLSEGQLWEGGHRFTSWMRSLGLVYAEIYSRIVGDFARCDGRPRSCAPWISGE